MTQPRLLIVDDEEHIRVAMRTFFSHRGFLVDSASEREEAEALLVNFTYACVIADLRLSAGHGADGLEILGFVKERCPDTRIILLTAYSSPAVEGEARRRGVDLFIHKPKPLAEVGRLVEGLMGRAAAS